MPHIYAKEHHSTHNPVVNIAPNGPRINAVQTLFEWKAPSRPYKKKDSSYYRTVAIIIVLLMLVTFFWLKDVIVIGVLLALGFVVYVLGFVPPEEIIYRISTQGITISDNFYFWQDLNSFWFTNKDGFNLLHIVTRLNFPGRLIIVVNSHEIEKIKGVVAQYLPFHEIIPTSFTERWANKLQKLFPLESHS